MFQVEKLFNNLDKNYLSKIKFIKEWVILKKMLVICFLFLIYSFSFSFSRVYVKGYYRKNGTYVQSHYRSSPKSSGRRSYYYPKSSGRKSYYYSSNSYYGGRESNYYSSNSYYDSASSKKNEFLNLKENNTNDIIRNNDEILSNDIVKNNDGILNNDIVKNNDEVLNNDILVQVSDGDIEKVKIYKVIEITDNNGNSRIELNEESLKSINLFDKTYIIIRNYN